MYSASVLVVLALCVACAVAIYPPRAPVQGSYTWELVISDNNGPEAYSGGRTLYDYVSGYVRMDAFNESDPSPGINGVTLWDLREQQPVVWTIDSAAMCWMQRLDSNVSVPPPLDFTGYSFNVVTYYNRALAEEWTDGYGGVVYVDVFTRDIVGMGNTSTVDDGTTIFYNIMQWSDKKPDGTLFLLPDTIPCKQVGPSEEVAIPAHHVMPIKPHFLGGFKCTACKVAIGVVIGRLCTTAGAAACAAFPPAIPFCSVLANLACRRGASLGKAKACKVIHAC